MSEIQNTTAENISENQYLKEKDEIIDNTDFPKWCMLTETKFQQCSVSEKESHKDFSMNFLNLINPDYIPVFEKKSIQETQIS